MKRHALCLNYVDWLADTRVRCCSAEERGVWVEVLMFMNQAQRRGVLELPLERIAQLVGSEVKVLHSLIRQGLLKGQDAKGEYGPAGAANRLPMMRAAEHGEQRGQMVIVLDEPDGPLWFCDWMVAEALEMTPAADVMLKTPQRPTGGSERQVQGSINPEERLISWESKQEEGVRAIGGLFDFASSKGSMSDTNQTGEAELGENRKVPNCPHARLIELYQRVLPTAKKVVVVGPSNELGKALKARWRSLAVAADSEFTGYTCVEDGLRKWAAIFALAGRSKFLTGRVPNRNGEAPFELSLMWLVGPKNMEKLLNGFYNRDAEERGTPEGVKVRSAMAERVLSGVEQVMAMKRRMGGPGGEEGALNPGRMEALPL